MLPLALAPLWYPPMKLADALPKPTRSLLPLNRAEHYSAARLEELWAQRGGSEWLLKASGLVCAATSGCPISSHRSPVLFGVRKALLPSFTSSSPRPQVPQHGAAPAGTGAGSGTGRDDCSPLPCSLRL